jgi:hypothetical protein
LSGHLDAGGFLLVAIDAAGFPVAADGICRSAKVEDAADGLRVEVDMNFEGMAS